MSGADLSDALSDMWRSVLLFVPTALAFLAILLIGYVLARLVRTVVVKTLSRIGFDRAVERGAIGRALGGRVEPSDLCAKIAFYAVLLFALQLAFGIWGPNAVSDLLTALIGWLPRAFVAIVIIVVAAAIGGAVRDLIGSALGGLAYGRVLAQAAYWLIVALGVIAALDQVQIATAVTQPVLIAVLATVAGVLIVGVGGGLIRPMQRRWEIWLERASTESAAIREHARSYADERARAAALAAEQARLAEQARIDEQARVEEQARIDEEERQARAAAEAEAARVSAEQAEAERVSAERAEAERVSAERVSAEAARAEASRAEAARVEALAAEEAERRRAAEAAGERTQVIPMQRPWPGSDDLPHVVPGFDDPVPVDTAETTTWLHLDAGADARPGDGSAGGSPDGRPDDGPDAVVGGRDGGTEVDGSGRDGGGRDGSDRDGGDRDGGAEAGGGGRSDGPVAGGDRRDDGPEAGRDGGLKSGSGGTGDGPKVAGGGSGDGPGAGGGGADGPGSGGGRDAGDGSDDVGRSASRPGERREVDDPAADVRASATASDKNSRVGSGSASSADGGPDDGTEVSPRSDDDPGAGERPGEDTAGAVSALAAGSPVAGSASEPGTAADDESSPSRPAGTTDAGGEGASGAGTPAGDGRDGSDGQVQEADDDAETTADVTGQRSGTAPAGADADSTVVISRSELRQALPQQSDPADGEKTQVIRVRRDDGPGA